MTFPRIFPARLFIAVIVAAPIPLGAARPLAWSLLAALMALGLISWAWELARYGTVPAVALRRIAVPGMLFIVTLAWGVVQALPVMPEAWTHPVWRQAEAALGPLPRTISLTPHAGFESVLRLGTYGAAFFLALQIGRARKAAGWMVEGLALGAIVLATYGIVEYASGTETILWMEKWDYRGTLTATLVNRNHYATLAGLGLLCTLVAVGRRVELSNRSSAMRALLTGGPRLWALLMGVPILLAALVFTQSRAGVGAAMVGVTVLALARKGLGGRRGGAVGFCVLALALILTLAMRDRLSLLSEDVPTRLAVYSTSLSLLQQRPWLGSGLGAFADAFAAVRPVGMTQVWDRAHCDWLEMAVELGLPAAASLFVSLLWLAGRCLAGVVIRRRDRTFPALGLAAAVLVGSHALVDFSLQIPAVAITFAAILGIAVAQSWSTRDEVGQ